MDFPSLFPYPTDQLNYRINRILFKVYVKTKDFLQIWKIFILELRTKDEIVIVCQ